LQFHVENGDAVMAGQPLYDIEIRAAPMAISKIFVANHDEIAVRIIRGPRLGIQTVQAVVAADGACCPRLTRTRPCQSGALDRSWHLATNEADPK
jgi:hypothetical protein